MLVLIVIQLALATQHARDVEASERDIRAILVGIQHPKPSSWGLIAAMGAPGSPCAIKAYRILKQHQIPFGVMGSTGCGISVPRAKLDTARRALRALARGYPKSFTLY